MNTFHWIFLTLHYWTLIIFRAKKGLPKSATASPKVKRSFHKPRTSDELQSLKAIHYVDNTNHKSRWAVKTYIDWRKSCIETSCAEFCNRAILVSDLITSLLLEPAPLCDALCKFVTEMRKENSQDYPLQMVKGIITSIQMYLKSNKIYWKLLHKDGGQFSDLFCVVDNIMKEQTKFCEIVNTNLQWNGKYNVDEWGFRRTFIYATTWNGTPFNRGKLHTTWW